ncbi:uncharacterized protein LOC112461697 [Temnothorax curvispinosus]|uniref:Uncharacterized protein LOC112461697 n=1 Tax=Temnothorax curvispinosus TaxID=300111 RepID=A0A6J1QLL1_9HYME|nr:uncharacterized protein LOC112461697 [Temnothorax curvispinosus]
MVGLVARMKAHVKKCNSTLVDDVDVVDEEHEDSASDSSSIASIRSRSPSRITTDTSDTVAHASSSTSRPTISTLTKSKLRSRDMESFIYATNSAFRHVEHPEFIKLINLLHPEYKPPLRRQIANKLLNEVFDSELAKIKDCLNGKTVCMAQDGWSNIHNDSIVCIAATDIIEETVHLCDIIDAEGNSHTAEYLLNLAVLSIKSCQKHGCKVRSFVTDNAANMRKMREQLATCEELGMPDIITYGCFAHILNLLAHDIEIPGIKGHVKKIMKYFRNTHFAAAKYKEAGGKALVMPQDVRWDTLADCLESYISNWHILSKVCTDNRVAISSDISSKVNDTDLKIKATDYLEKLKIISVALDKIQRDCCIIGEATEIWIEIIKRILKRTFFWSPILIVFCSVSK